MSTREMLRGKYGWIAELKRFAAENKIDDRKMTDAIRRERKEIHRIELDQTDPLFVSMKDGWRHGISEDGETGFDYCICQDCGESVDEIREWAECEVGYPEINSPYDCTGRRFTMYILVKKVPVGFAVVHRWALDV